MKHILNNLTEQEKSAIREQHTGGMKLNTEKFKNLIETKQGDVKPLVSEQSYSPLGDVTTGSSHKAVKAVFDSCRNVPQSPINAASPAPYRYHAARAIPAFLPRQPPILGPHSPHARTVYRNHHSSWLWDCSSRTSPVPRHRPPRCTPATHPLRKTGRPRQGPARMNSESQNFTISSRRRTR